jgi:hypothetical protein
MRVWTARIVALAAVLGCTNQQRIDPHTPGDRCLYSCPEGMVCEGTTFARGRSNPGLCRLAPRRCVAPTDCRPRELCVRPGPAIGVCQPESLL